MKTLMRFCAWFVMRSLERQFNDELAYMSECTDTNDYLRIYHAHQITREELCRASSAYIAMLPPGERRTWRTA